jgi:hypothetical protein
MERDELDDDERMYTGEPVETSEGTYRPRQMNVGKDNMEGGGEWPDPHTEARGSAPGSTEEQVDDEVEELSSTEEE